MNSVFESMSERQIKEKIRYLSDKLEKIYENLKPQLDEFNLIQEELTELLDYADSLNE